MTWRERVAQPTGTDALTTSFGARSIERVRNAVHNSARIAWGILAAALVQDYFDGWALGAWWTPIAAALGIASVAFVATWAPVSRRFATALPYRVVRRDTRVPTPDVARADVTDASDSDSFLASAVAWNHDRIVRSNVQSVIDELAWATRLINEAVEDHGGFWTQPIHWATWENVKDGLAAERGFHVAYEATRAAWDAVQRAELDRLNHEPREDIRPREERHITTALERAAAAHNALLAFLADHAAGGSAA